MFVFKEVGGQIFYLKSCHVLFKISNTNKLNIIPSENFTLYSTFPDNNKI